METKYSRKEFEGYTHRFIVNFKIDGDWRNDTKMDIYSNSDSYEELDKFITAKKSDKVVSFEIIHKSSKIQDDMNSKFIDEWLNSVDNPKQENLSNEELNVHYLSDERCPECNELISERWSGVKCTKCDWWSCY